MVYRIEGICEAQRQLAAAGYNVTRQHLSAWAHRNRESKSLADALRKNGIRLQRVPRGRRDGVVERAS